MRSRWMYCLSGAGFTLALIAALVGNLFTLLLGVGILWTYWHLGEYYRKEEENGRF